jgi:hypothetical protein
VHVLDHDDQRLPSRPGLEQPPHRREHLARLARLFGHTHGGGHLGCGRRRVRLAGEQLGEPVDPGPADELAHDLAQRPERQPIAVGRAVPGHHPGARPYGLGELARQPRLSHTGIPEDRDQNGTPFPNCAFEAATKVAELGLPPDKGCVEGPVWRW